VIKNIEILKEYINNDDVWIIGGGSSLNFISNNFFENKKVLGINNALCKFDCIFSVTKEPEDLFKDRPKDKCLIMSKHKAGNCGNIYNLCLPHDIVFDHIHNMGEIDADFIDGKEEKVIVSSSTLSSAIHIAAIAKAKNIILCGCENESRNGNLYMDGYQISKRKNCSFTSVSEWMSSDNVNLDLTDLIKKIIGVYEIDIHILEPWKTLEDKKFDTSVNCEFDTPTNNKVFPH